MVYQIISCLQPISARRRPGLLLRTNYSDPIFIGNDWLPQRDRPKLLTLGETLGFACDHPVQLGKLDGVVDRTAKSGVITDEQAGSFLNIGLLVSQASEEIYPIAERGHNSGYTSMNDGEAGRQCYGRR